MEPLPDPTVPESPQVEKSKIETTEKKELHQKVKIAPKALKLTKVEQKNKRRKIAYQKQVIAR